MVSPAFAATGMEPRGNFAPIQLSPAPKDVGIALAATTENVAGAGAKIVNRPGDRGLEVITWATLDQEVEAATREVPVPAVRARLGQPPQQRDYTE